MLSSTLKTKTLNSNTSIKSSGSPSPSNSLASSSRSSLRATNSLSFFSSYLNLALITLIVFLLGFLISFFSSSLFLSPKSSHADEVAINLEIAATTNMNVSTTCNIALSINSPFNYCDTTATINSNNPTGYELYLSSPEETTTASDNTCIRHSSTIPPTTANPTACSTIPTTHKFTPTTTPTDENGTFITLPSDYTTNPNANLSPFTKGTWGVSYISTTATNGTNYTKFTGLPSYASTPLKVKDTDNVAVSDTTTIRSAAHYNLTSDTTKNQTTGSYQGKVLFTVVNKPLPPCQGGTCATDYGYMQNFTATECNQMSNYDTTIGEITYTTNSSYIPNNTLAGTNTVYLTDSRNSQLYRIRKMQDGKCWMIDNLKIYNKTLTSADSDIASGSFTLPATLNTVGSTNNTSVRVDNPSSSAASDGGTYCNTTVYTTFPNTTTGCGYLYNWYAATAGKGTPDLVNTTVTDSICPKNWNLPTGGSGGQFETLNNAISLVAGGGQSFQAPYSGNLYTAGFSNQGTAGYYWSSTAYSSATYAYYLSFNSSSANPSSTNYKYVGFGVRCLL